jgi:phosphohistidine swiveling domain-containing protein
MTAAAAVVAVRFEIPVVDGNIRSPQLVHEDSVED